MSPVSPVFHTEVTLSSNRPWWLCGLACVKFLARSEVEILCRYSNSRALGGLLKTAYNIEPSRMALWLWYIINTGSAICGRLQQLQNY